MSDATEPSGAKVRPWDRLWVQIALAIFLVLAVFAVAFYGFAVIGTHPARLWPWSAKTHPGLYELSRTAVPVAALVGGAAAIVVGIRRQRSTEKTVELTARTAQITADAYALDQKRAGREEIDRLRDRYTTIAAQLGDDAAPVRLAGVYAMAALADDWITMGNHREAQVCIDVLCAYIRTPRNTSTSEDAVADTRVRETITRVITQHLQEGATTSWSDKAFDFTEAHFTGSHSFSGARFNDGCRVAFLGAEFNKGCLVDFSDARFNDGCRVDFSDARFNDGCWVTFPSAWFNDGCWVTFPSAWFNDGCRV
ncbi:pentapeptide repeat-containing protein, partial [Yimella sp. cx-51]